MLCRLLDGGCVAPVKDAGGGGSYGGCTPRRIERHQREESIMKGRLITVYTLVITATAVLAPIAAAGRTWP